MSDHWSTRHLTDQEVRTHYARIMSRVAGGSFTEVVDELRARLEEAREQGWLEETGPRVHPPPRLDDDAGEPAGRSTT
jgi:hypothetical protein